MSKYRRQPTDEEIREGMIERGELNEDGTLVDPEPPKDEGIEPKPQEHDWKKRYDDSRRFAQNLQNESKAKDEEIERLRRELETKADVPVNEAEFKEWLEKYPKLADKIQILARKEAQEIAKSFGEEQKKVVDDLNRLKIEQKVEEERAKLRKLQPDFYTEIANSAEFHDWLENTASRWAKEAILSPKTPDAQTASDVIDLYKMRRKPTKEEKPDTRTTEREAASGVRQSGAPAVKKEGEGRWSESKVKALSNAMYEKYEQEIHDAMAKGEFDYDISGAS